MSIYRRQFQSRIEISYILHEFSALRALIANIAISFSILSPKYLNKAFLVLHFKFFTQHETFIFKQFEGTDFTFDTHSYSNRNIQTRYVGPNDKVTLFRWRYFIFIFINFKFKVADIESVNNILKFLLSNIYFKYVLSPGLYFVKFWDDDFWAYKKLQFQ